MLPPQFSGFHYCVGPDIVLVHWRRNISIGRLFLAARETRLDILRTEPAWLGSESPTFCISLILCRAGETTRSLIQSCNLVPCIYLLFILLSGFHHELQFSHVGIKSKIELIRSNSRLLVFIQIFVNIPLEDEFTVSQAGGINPRVFVNGTEMIWRTVLPEVSSDLPNDDSPTRVRNNCYRFHH